MPWSEWGNSYIWDFCGVVGGLHLFGLSEEFAFLFIEGVAFVLVIDLSPLKFHDILLLLGDLLLQLADLVDNLIEFLLGLQQLRTDLA